jgi:tRNA(Ile)-lysidine synthase
VSLVERVDAAVARLGLEGARLLVAVSGGVDSSALLDALLGLRGRRRLELHVGHVNHGLRGAAADADETWVRERARDLGLPFWSESVRPGCLQRGRPSSRRPSLQEAARRLRYRALAAMAAAAGGARIATAHTRDDQAETVLLRLLRGTGPDGLRGIPESSRDGRVVRPLLAASREEVLAHARERRLSWREDPSNRNPRFGRSRLRHRWLPALAREFNPQLLRSLAELAEAQQREAEWIERLVEAEAERRIEPGEGTQRIARAGFEALPEALSRRLLRRAWRGAGGSRHVSRAHLERMRRFLVEGRPGAVLELPGGFRLECGPAAACLRRLREDPAPAC